MNSMTYLVAAILFELVATSALKASDGFSRLLPSVITVLGYGASYYLLAMTLKRMEVGVVYAIWAGTGTALMAIIGWWFFNEDMTMTKLVSIALIVCGVIGLNVGDRLNHLS
jgi:small multidrug resistance pump